ncbi:MAG: Endo-beta-mannanase [Verrucomicrobiales bacterium]|nr:Endo-beta-mannanase [Verrucomicrobiales bacterium]
MRSKPSIRLLLAPLLLLQCTRGLAESLWQEGEAPVSSKMQRHPWWFDQVKKEVLSGGDYISNFGKEEGTTDYQVTVEEAGAHVLWVRANPVGTTLSWKLGSGEWQPIDLAKEPRGQQNIAADGKPDLRFIAWVKVGTVTVPAGPQKISFRMHGGKDNHGGLDCFVLTNDGFVPNGIARPGAAAPPGPAEWFPLMVDDDAFSAESVIDVSALNEAPAGKHGPVIAKGDTLVFAGRPGEPVKFWGCGANLEAGKNDRAQQERRVKYLRKFGINAVREHPLFDEIQSGGKIDPAKLDAYDWWFSKLKEQGIYTHWSVFYHFPVSAADGYDPALFAELEAMEGGSGLRDSYGLITMSPELQALRLKVLVALLNHKNPYTGLRYADEPALIGVEFQNEDSIFFWNPLGDLAAAAPKKWPLHAKRLREAFGAWAKKTHGDDAAVAKAWGGLDGESTEGGLALMGPWEISGEGIRGRFAGNVKRAGDQTRFLAEMQMGFFRQAEEAIRKTGYKAQTITTNWLGGSALLDQANIYTDTVGTQIDRHNYAGGGAGGHGIAEGAVFADSHLGKPGAYLFSIGMKQVEDRPFSLTEWTMCPPNRWKLEAAPLLAFYGMGLQGWDASYHFAQSGTRLGEGWPDMGSYRTDTPHYMGQFPALALAVRKGHLKEGPLAAARRTTADEVFAGQPAWLQDYYDGEKFFRSPNGTPGEVFAMGRVTVGFQGGKDTALDFNRFWDRPAKVIRSATGELAWDYGKECVRIAAPRTQGLIGRPGEKPVQLPAVKVLCRTPFVSLLFTALDDMPLAESRHILITALAQDKQTGAAYSDDGTKLVSVGTAPLLLEPVQADIWLKGGIPTTVRALDPWGVRKGKPLTVKADGGFAIDGTAQAYYYEVVR